MLFGERLLSSQHPPWSEKYIDYRRLKCLLITLFGLETSPKNDVGSLKAQEAPSFFQTNSIGGSTSKDSLLHCDLSSNDISPLNQHVKKVTTSRSFCNELNYEIEKVLLFLLKSIGELATDLSTLSEHKRFMSLGVQTLLDEKETSPPQKKLLLQKQLHDIESIRMEYLVTIGTKLLLLLEFVELNVDAIVKIVKKHDKLLSKWEESKSGLHQEHPLKYTRLRRQYLPRFAVYSSNPNVRCLFLMAADAGDSNRTKDVGHLAIATTAKSDGKFGGWDVIQENLESSLRELHQWATHLRHHDECMTDKAGQSQMSAASTPHTFTPISSKSFSEMSSTLSSGHSTKATKGFRSSYSILGLASKFSSSQAKVDNLSDSGAAASFFEPMVYQIQSSRQRLNQTQNRYIRMVYAHEMLHLVKDEKALQQDDEYYLLQSRETFGSVEKLERIRKQSIDGEDEGKKLMNPLHPTVSRLSKLLNLASAGLYMCGYNIVGPTAGLYAQLLGFDKAGAGLVIGMTPAAVLLSSVLYSWWSSYSYKRAILFASFCCMTGNLIYALALPCNSFRMVLLGRMINGFGSARVINRRYIADYYSIESRTSGMSDMVSVSALGLALGPGVTVIINMIADAGEADTFAIWTSETAPGYFMFVLWAIYLICNILFFEEPDRLGSRAKAGSQGTQTAFAQSENKPLLKSPNDVVLTSDDGVKDAKPKCPRSCGNTPVLVSLGLLVLLKSIVEGLMSSAPTLSRYYFGWGLHSIGIFLVILSSLVLPTNFFVAYISQRFDDRELILGSLVTTLIGILGFLVYSEDGSEYSEARFILFGIVMYVSCNALEGPVMGLLSKTIPKSLARGVLNAGLLSTQAGTLGRVVGDLWLSGATYLGLNEMLNRLFEPMCVTLGVSIFVVIWSYPRLQPRFDDEDDD